MGIDAITKTDKGALNAPSTDAAWGDWIAATDVRNFALRDPLLDGLDVFGGTVGFQPDTAIKAFGERTSRALLLMRQSQRFEDAVIKHLE
jgi:hypothetical protein